MAHTLIPIAGVDLDVTEDSASAVFPLGIQTEDTDGVVYEYVQASGAITQHDMVAIDESHQAAACTKALADAGHSIGFAQIAFADNEHGWVARHGKGIQVRAAASCAPDVALYTTSTAGVVDDTSASQTKINGIVAISTATSGVTSLEIIADWPRAEQPA